MNFTSQTTTKTLQLSLFILFIINTKTTAQIFDKVKTEAELQATGTTGNVVPFWMRSNQYGSVPTDGASGSFIARAYKPYSEHIKTDSSTNRKLVDWGFGFEGRANAGNNSSLTLIEAYAKLRVGAFQLKGGRSKDVMGLNGDTSLSSGNFAISGNALGIPKAEISIPEYYAIPVLQGLFSIKGNFAHGWLGNVKGSTGNNYFHQKSLYMRIGKPDWRLKLYGGFNHQTFWGNEKDLYGENFDLSRLQTLYYVFLGKTYKAKGVGSSKLGNQLGSIDLGAEYNFDNFKIMLYRQNFYDVGALAKLANIADGLNGVSITNNHQNSKSSGFKWKKVLFEFFYSKDQAGYPWSKKTKSGDEDYYNNAFYRNGWSYYGPGLGNPLITPRSDAKEGQAYKKSDYFINNRVVAIHLGFQGEIDTWEFSTKITHSWNYGTFGTSIYGNTTGNKTSPGTSNIFTPVQQFSVYLEGLKELKKNYRIGFATALDQGKLLNNSFGASLRLIKGF
nr:capsule assembly Wzi family protein [Pedobacter panaciterrae]